MKRNYLGAQMSITVSFSIILTCKNRGRNVHG